MASVKSKVESGSHKEGSFEPVAGSPDFVALEKELLEKWYKKGIVQKYLRKNQKSSKVFSFLDGPITANNPMGVHHGWGRTYKDLWQRWRNMLGFKQRFQNGFDCQGLWVEVEVEKELGLKSKKDIENLVPGDKKRSIAKFVELCKERVYKFAKIQTEQSKRLGYFMDWENSYYTMSDDNNYMIWHFLKKCQEKSLIYKGRDSVPWCPRCGTAISEHEMLTEDYKETTHDSVYIEYPVKGKDFSLLVWTTTPWTLPGNVAVAIDPDANYEVWERRGRKVLVHENLEGFESSKTDRHFKGSDIVGLEYESPFDDLPRVKNSLGKYVHKVIATESLILPISSDEGTGLVHVAPGAGSEDFQLGKKLGLPVIELIDEEANYLNDLNHLSGKNAKQSPEMIIDFLREQKGGKYLFDVVSYKHRYPACWRCKEELVWRVVDEWYIAMDKGLTKKQKNGKTKKRNTLRESLKNIARRINWIPEFGLKRELEWLDNMHDWLISKKRYWGLALPIWECKKCGSFEVVGGKEELKEKAVSGWEAFEGHSPHRPWIDEVRIRCSKCGSLTSRIPDVGNPWLDAGIVPFSTISEDNKSRPLYLEDREQWEKWFPADFITESFPGQFKNWFYSLLVMSTVLVKSEPFKTVLGFATLLAEDGRPMHKSWGNAIEFDEGADKIGVDIMRWVYLRQAPEQNLEFGYKTAAEVRRRFYLILWNSYKFFVTYANLVRWDCSKTPKDVVSRLTVLDRFILARLTQVVLEVNKSLEKFDAQSAAFVIQEFVVGDLSTWYIRRSRDRVGVEGTKEDEDVFLATLYGVLVTLSKLLAPFMPFISDVMYKNLTGEESVHLEEYPLGDESLLDEKLVHKMRFAREVVATIHKQRKEAGIPVRQPLSCAHVEAPFVLDQDFLEIIKEEVNVKKIVIRRSADLKETVVKLDIEITGELEEEGKTREIARVIQEERKRLGVSFNDKVYVIFPWLPKNPELVAWLKKRVLANSIKKGKKFHVGTEKG